MHSDQEPPFHSKPDRLTDTLELRRLNWSDPQDPDAIETDFYELYWAHLMQGTVWSHVIAWLRVLMFRIPFFDAGRGVIVLWILSWAVCLSAIAYLAYHQDISSSELVGTGAVAALALVVFRAFGSLGLRYVGDAARYLSPTPQNIEARKNIRNAVIQLLTKMHEESPIRYNRIIVVGHSLGSVIAYDALTHLWQQRHSTISNPSPSMQPKMEVARTVGRSLAQLALERSGAGNSDDLHERYRIAQRELLTEQLELGVSWRISDLVTLGSPLTHACFLLAENPADWRDLLRERVYPTCPPQPEDSRDTGKPKQSKLEQSKLEQSFFYNNLEQRLPYTDDNSFRLKILHHAALFACTRWTNLYFPSDPVGGELTGVSGFGNGIKDVPLKPAGWLTRTPASHVHYWDRKERHAIEALLAALDLKDSVGRATLTDVGPAHHFDVTVREKMAEVVVST